ncbi:hypothetical protein ACPPVW_18300 [Leifsonia sp. McL0607]|uniref:hypothetical protein n=1 Tax=Leifsonia sp. McL0607 TaxID=3415672 RepID=UPI003CF5B9B0
MLLTTFFSQHPNRVFDRLRSRDKIGFWLPNWRFFAPEPAQNDFHILHRTLSVNGEESDWEETHETTPRRLRHFVWFPDRRIDKGIFDAAAELMAVVPLGEKRVLTCPAYRAVSAFVLRRITDNTPHPVAGYQFMLATSTGYDETTEPEELLTSPYIPMEHS